MPLYTVLPPSVNQLTLLKRRLPHTAALYMPGMRPVIPNVPLPQRSSETFLSRTHLTVTENQTDAGILRTAPPPTLTGDIRRRSPVDQGFGDRSVDDGGGGGGKGSLLFGRFIKQSPRHVCRRPPRVPPRPPQSRRRHYQSSVTFRRQITLSAELIILYIIHTQTDDDDDDIEYNQGLLPGRRGWRNSGRGVTIQFRGRQRHYASDKRKIAVDRHKDGTESTKARHKLHSYMDRHKDNASCTLMTRLCQR